MKFRVGCNVMIEAHDIEHALRRIGIHLLNMGEGVSPDDETYESPVLLGEIKIGPCDDKGNRIGEEPK